MGHKSASRFIYYIFLLLLVLIPLSLIIIQSFIDVNVNFTLTNYQQFFSPIYLKMTFNSFLYAGLITFFCLILAYPLAYGLTKLKYQKVILLLIIIPSWINLLLKAYAFLGLLGSQGIVNQIIKLLTGDTVNLLFNVTGFLIVSVYIFLPFTIIPLYNGIKSINPNIARASNDLGATKLQTLRFVHLPLSKQAVYSAIQIVFIPSLSIFMITRLIAGNRIITLGTAIEQHFLTTGNWGIGSAIGTILIITLIISILIINKVNKRKRTNNKYLVQGGTNA